MLSPETNAYLIVNPVSGFSDPPIEQLKNYMAQVDCKTRLQTTTVEHTAADCVGDAIDDNADLVIVYGGDGTVMEVANSLHGHNIPLAILAGGTANVIASGLQIPEDIGEALDLVFTGDNQLRSIDAGCLNDDYFLLRLGIGWEAEISQRPTAEEKSDLGTIAYTRAALKSLSELETVTYEITLDNDTVERITGINCSICNIGSVGIFDLKLANNIQPDDGLLDVLILQSEGIQAILDLGENIVASSLELNETLPHYKAQKVKIAPSKPQHMSKDGETFETDLPITVECVTDYISIVTPKSTQ